MNRSGYYDDNDDQWAHIRWRGAVEAAIKGSRGQAFLKELEDALLALPEKKLLRGGFSMGGEVCAIGSVLVERKVKAGMSRKAALAEVATAFKANKWKDTPDAAPEAGIADAMAREIMSVNDDDFCHPGTKAKRYERVLAWVREQREKVTSQGHRHEDR